MNSETIAKLSKSLSDADSVIGEWEKSREQFGTRFSDVRKHGFQNVKGTKIPETVRLAYVVRDSFKVTDSLMDGSLSIAVAEHRKADGAARRKADGAARRKAA